MYKPVQLLKRKLRPIAAGGLFNGILHALGGGPADSDLISNWRKIVGDEIADMADLVSLSKASKKTDAKPRNMTIRAHVPAMATLLSYKTEDIKKSVNKYFGYESVGKIIIKK